MENETTDVNAIDSGIRINIPAEGENQDQKLAYQSFIRVLSEILIKYASEVDSNNRVA